MKVLYDGEIYAMYAKQSGGISRYFDNLISRLPEEFSPILTTARNRGGSHPIHPNLNLLRYDFNFYPNRISRWFRNRYFKHIVSQYEFQIAHPTYYSLLTGQSIQDYKCPIVITVYDMIHEIFSDSMDPYGIVSELKRKAVFSAHSILCISESTRQDLLERYPALEERTTVTLLATELGESCISQAFITPNRPYYLYVGARENYKNFDQLLLAFANLTTKFPHILLCVVGSPFKKKEHKRIAELNLTNNIEHYGMTSDSQLAKLYNASIALVYPSLYEGFGIPPLEAMSCGTAVIASNVSSIPEVVGDAGLLFDPKSTDELVDHLLSLVEHPSQRNSWIEKGKRQVQKFSWEKTTTQTVDIYRSLI